MELDELRNIWQKNPAGFIPKDEEEIARMMRGNSSRSIVDKLKRSVWFELIFTIVAGMGLLAYAFSLRDGALKWTSISILILFVAYPVYYIKKLALLNRFNPDDHLRANLEKLIDNLTSYLRFYLRSYSTLYPVYFLLALVFLALEKGSEQFFESLSDLKTIGYLIFLAALFYFMSKSFTNWYLKKLYGNHLEKLKSLLRELDSFDKPEEVSAP